jgi:chorismate synthase
MDSLLQVGIGSYDVRRLTTKFKSYTLKVVGMASSNYLQSNLGGAGEGNFVNFRVAAKVTSSLGVPSQNVDHSRWEPRLVCKFGDFISR